MKSLNIYFISIIFFVLVNVAYGQNSEKIKGIFEYNQILNGYSDLSTRQQKEYNEYISKINIELLDKYFEIIMSDIYNPSANDTIVNWDSISIVENRKYIIADSILATDSTLKGIEGRMAAILYTAYEINKLGLQDYIVICQTDTFFYGTINIFMTKKQYNKLKRKLKEPIELNLIFITEIKWTNFRVYKFEE